MGVVVDEEEEDEVAAAGVKGPGDGAVDVGGTRAIRTDYPLLDFSVSVLHQRGRGFWMSLLITRSVAEK